MAYEILLDDFLEDSAELRIDISRIYITEPEHEEPSIEGEKDYM